MMKTLDWYIGRTILTTSLFSLLVLAGLSSLFRFVEQLKYVGRGSYETLDVALYVLFSLPRDLEVFFPMAALLGGLIGMGMLASHSELVVMQAAGMSKFNIITSAMKTCLIMAVAVMAIGEWLAPASEAAAKEVRTRAISGGNLFFGERGTWAKDGNNFVHIGQVDDKDNLTRLSIYYFDESNNLTQIIKAESARFSNEQWQLKAAEITSVNEQLISLEKQPNLSWRSSLTPDKLITVTVKPEALSVSGLVSYLDYLNANQQDPARYQLALWRKIFQPVTVLVMLLVAMSFIFGPLRSVTMGARIMLGVITGFAFSITNQIFGPLSLVYELPPLAGAVLPSLAFTAVSVYLLRR